MEPLVVLDAVVTQEEFGERWPFCVPEGRVIAGVYQLPGADVCTVALTFEGPDLTLYALNGVARTYGLGQDLIRIWPLSEVGQATVEGEDPPTPERPDLFPLIYLGLNLAEAEGHWTW